MGLYCQAWGCVIATYYVGVGGNDGNNGTTWALRKLTLDAVEDLPVAAGDIVYVGPGTYRESLTVDVDGTSGNEIIYIGDVTGEHTDGVGGIVRITGSDDDQGTDRNNCIIGSTDDYRTFRGFHLDTCALYVVDGDNCDNWTIEDCTFENGGSVILADGGSTNWTIRRCMFLGGQTNITFAAGAAQDSSGHVVQNCLFVGTRADGIDIQRVGDVIVRNCAFFGAQDCIDVSIAPNNGHPCLVNNCIICWASSNGVEATAVADMTEDYNLFWGNASPRGNVNVGGNSVAYPPLFLPPILNSGAGQVSGFRFPWLAGMLSEWCQVRALAGSNEATEDLHGLVRPTTAAKNSWGPLQFMDAERETGTVQAGSVSIALHDAGSHQIFVPVSAASTTITVYCYRETDYAGTNPRMVVKQPGQADDTTTDTGSSGAWNQLSTTLTPSALPPYVIVELQSLNTAAAGDYKAFFDTLVVT